jgi:Nucleotidyltransferase of unknown function (DUF6036)
MIQMTRKMLTIAEARIPNAMDFALRNRVLLLKNAGGVEIDVGIAGLPFEEAMISCASSYTITSSIRITTCSAEDLIVMKAFANRPRDWGDIEGVARKQRSLDWNYVDAALAPLAELKEEPEILTALAKLKSRVIKTP